jgi:hypothetical protein
MQNREELPARLQQLSDEELTAMGFDFDLHVYTIGALLAVLRAEIEEAMEAKVDGN